MFSYIYEIIIKVDGLKLLAVVVSLLGIYIAYRQHVVYIEKVKLDLFDKRYKIYDRLYYLIGGFGFDDTVTQKKQIKEFVHLRREARCLFGSEISEYLDLMYRKILRTYSLTREAEERSKETKSFIQTNESWDKDFEEVIQWFISQNNGNFDNYFRPYLSVSKWGIPPKKHRHNHKESQS